jgi:hypothetical protein
MFDPTLDQVGFPLDHPYIERVYCSVLGPTSVLMLRRFGELLAENPRGVSVDLVDLSRSLGVGPRGTDGELGRNAPVRRTMDRLVQFRLAAWQGDDRLGVLTKVPAVSRHHAERLCQPVQVTHERLLTDHLGAVVARAEGRELPVSAVHVLADPTAAPGPKPPGSDVAARLAAFGANGHDPRSIVR